MEQLTVRQLVAEAAEAISRSRAIDHWMPALSKYDAEELMAAVLGTELTPAIRRSLPVPAQRRMFAMMVARRIAGQPVAQITGRFVFRGLELAVQRDVFAPRASSELLAEEAITFLRRRRGPRVAVDVATGSGPMALAIAHDVPSAEVWGLDISPHAVRLARRNATRLGLANVRFRVSDLLSALPLSMREHVDILTIHPPYVARHEVRALPREIRDFEPVTTLTDGSADGLELVRRISAEAPQWLRPGGRLFVEIGTYLSRRAQAALRHAELEDVTWTKDSLGVTRVVSGRAPKVRL
jgi:release factor glutamine methyltransferase